MPLTRHLTRCLAVALLLFALPAFADVASQVQALITRGDLPGALRAAEAGAQATPRDPQGRFLQGVVLMEMQRNTEAEVQFRQLAEEYPELPEPHNNLALLHVRAGRLELARQALETALRNDPGHRAARANLGEVHLMLAVQAWERAAAQGPLDPRLMRKLDAARALVISGASAAR